MSRKWDPKFELAYFERLASDFASKKQKLAGYLKKAAALGEISREETRNFQRMLKMSLQQDIDILAEMIALERELGEKPVDGSEKISGGETSAASVLPENEDDSIEKTAFRKAEFWDEVKAIIRGKIGQPSYGTWFSSLSAYVDDDLLIIVASNEFARDWLEERYKTLIFDTVQEVEGCTYEIEIVTVQEWERGVW